jgi:ubiquinone/menaquinone biosynthesis C-methylase UbiE
MVARARARLHARGSRVRLWTGDAAHMAAADGTYDALFDFGILHHVPDWRRAVAEVARVLKPGGRFYAEEVLHDFIVHPLMQRLFAHPQHDRFDRREFADALESCGLQPVACTSLGGAMAWFVADLRS